MSLPAAEALFNSIAFFFVTIGFLAIRRGNRSLHIKCMISALVASTIFLVLYLIYHLTNEPKPYVGEWVTFYRIVLVTHIILAAVTPLLVGVTVFFAAKKKFDQHRRLARWTLPIWAYVSVTGVMVYFLVHH